MTITTGPSIPNSPASVDPGPGHSRPRRAGGTPSIPGSIPVLACGAATAVVAGIFPLAVGTAIGAAVGIYTLARYSLARLAWFCFGAIVVFQVGDGLTPLKVIYLAGVGTSLIIALVRLPRACRILPPERVRPALIGAALIAVWILLVGSTYSILVMKVGVGLWFRDSLTYLLLSTGVVLGVDAAADSSLRRLRACAFLLGGLAAVGFTTTWLARRGLSADVDGSGQQFLLASLCAILIPIALAFALGLAGRSHFPLLVYAAALLGSVLITGTRTGIVLLVMVLGFLGTRRFTGLSLSRVIIAYVAILLVGAFSVSAVASQMTDTGFIRARLESAIRALTQGVQYDPSGELRLRAYQSTWDIFSSHPLLGQGLGQPYPNPSPEGGVVYFALDTPFVLLSKFGVIGASVVIISMVFIAYAAVARTGGTATLEMSAARSATLVFCCLLPFGAFIEDKGLSLAISLALTLTLASVRDTRSTGIEPDVPGVRLTASAGNP